MNSPLTPSPINRRTALGALAGVVAVLAACGSDSQSSPTSSTSSSSATTGTTASSGTAGTTAATAAPTTSAAASSAASTSAATATCDPIPEETGGPYPGDGSNGPNVLNQDGVVRSDIRSSIGTASRTADGVQLTIDLTIIDAATGCTPLSGAAVYLWHCDREGNYSMYSPAAANENYLRGVQAADETGQLSFVSVFPGAYSGRWPHIHFEVYESVAAATGGGSPLITSQLALPEGTCDAVYATAGYEASVRNMNQTSLASDNVFGDDEAEHQLATMSGDIATGLIAALVVAV